MKKPKLNNEVEMRIALLAENPILGADLKATLEYISKLRTYTEVYKMVVEDLACQRNISQKQLKQMLNKVKRGIERYERQESEFIRFKNRALWARL